MKRNRLFLLLSIFLFAAISVDAQDFSKLENYKRFTAEQMKGDLEVVYGSIKSMGGEKYISQITEVEQAVCYEQKDFNKFIKTATKLIKQEKIPMIFESPQDIEYKTKVFAEAGKIIVVTEMDNEFASIAIVHGNPPSCNKE